MSKELSAKSFRSGNSIAIRMPIALGVEPGLTWSVTAQGGDLILSPRQPPRRTIDVSGFAGKAPGIRLAPREDFDERPSTIAARKAAETE